MTFNPTTAMFSTASGSKSLAVTSTAAGGPLTPKSHESHGNIIRPMPLRSRFFHAEDVIVKPPRPMPVGSFKPWFEDDKENVVDKSFAFGGGKMMFTPVGEKEFEKRCLQCYDKAAFALEPCSHTCLPPHQYRASANGSLCAKCMPGCINPLGTCHCIVCGQVSPPSSNSVEMIDCE
jgi:hypothetical protein